MNFNSSMPGPPAAASLLKFSGVPVASAAAGCQSRCQREAPPAGAGPPWRLGHAGPGGRGHSLGDSECANRAQRRWQPPGRGGVEAPGRPRVTLPTGKPPPARAGTRAVPRQLPCSQLDSRPPSPTAPGPAVRRPRGDQPHVSSHPRAPWEGQKPGDLASCNENLKQLEASTRAGFQSYSVNLLNHRPLRLFRHHLRHVLVVVVVGGGGGGGWSRASAQVHALQVGHAF